MTGMTNTTNRLGGETTLNRLVLAQKPTRKKRGVACVLWGPNFDEMAAATFTAMLRKADSAYIWLELVEPPQPAKTVSSSAQTARWGRRFYWQHTPCASLFRAIRRRSGERKTIPDFVRLLPRPRTIAPASY